MREELHTAGARGSVPRGAAETGGRRWVFILFLFVFASYVQTQSRSRDKWLQPDRLMDVLGIVPGMVIGEAGAGEGYFTFKLARRVGDRGHVYANDIVDRVLRSIVRRAEREGVTNITTVLGRIEDPLFPRTRLDMVVMLQAFHDFSRPVAWLKNVKRYLKTGAPVVIIDKDPERWPPAGNHFLTKSEILDLVEQAGFLVLHVYEFLERDTVYVIGVRHE